jgi:putative holliday junction resolvase
MMPEGTALGFDIGSKAIGVAIFNPLVGSARELEVVGVAEGGLDWTRLDALVKDWSPAILVVGDPLQLDPTAPEQPNRARARRFARHACQRYGLRVWLVDERHTSQEAARRFAAERARGTRRRRDAAHIDALAAVVILERWLVNPDSATEVTP